MYIYLSIPLSLSLYIYIYIYIYTQLCRTILCFFFAASAWPGGGDDAVGNPRRARRGLFYRFAHALVAGKEPCCHICYTIL